MAMLASSGGIRVGMTVIALLDTEMSPGDTGLGDKGLIDCMVGLPATARAPGLHDFDVRASGAGSAEVIGVTPLAGKTRNAYRLTIRHSGDAGLLAVRYRPERTATHGNKQGAGIDVTVMGSECRSLLDANGDEWHLPLSDAASAGRPAPGDATATSGLSGAVSGGAASSARPSLTEARVLPLQRPAATKPAAPARHASGDPLGEEELPDVTVPSASAAPRP